MTWLSDNIGSIVVCAVILILIVLAVRYIVRSMKTDKCVGCPSHGACGGGCGDIRTVEELREFRKKNGLDKESRKESLPATRR
ncbi:MAG: hypothetical protein LUG88_08655 [Clostridia bacterium]|nr:hypothetical protein [Clostridia bacterium]